MRKGLLDNYRDVLTPGALETLSVLAPLDATRRALMRSRIQRMSLDNQRNLKLAFARADVFMAAAAQVAEEMNAWAQRFLGRSIIQDWRSQLDFTTRIFRPRGLHLDDRHVRLAGADAARR